MTQQIITDFIHLPSQGADMVPRSSKQESQTGAQTGDPNRSPKQETQEETQTTATTSGADVAQEIKYTCLGRSIWEHYSDSVNSFEKTMEHTFVPIFTRNFPHNFAGIRVQLGDFARKLARTISLIDLHMFW